jgi:hypothetical protein
MVNTRNRVANNNVENNGENNNNDAMPTLEQVRYARTNALDHTADHGQHACSALGATTTTEG